LPASAACASPCSSEGRLTRAEHAPSSQLTREQLADAVRLPLADLDVLIERGLVKPAVNGLFRRNDIQRVRAIAAMRSPGIELEQLLPVFEQGLFVLDGMDALFADAEPMTDLTVASLAESLTIDADDVSRLLVAAGFAAAQPGDHLRSDDVTLVRSLAAIGRQLGSQEAALRIARLLGDNARRAADSGVALFNELVVSEVLRAPLNVTQRQQLNRMAAEVRDESELLLARLYRRHLEHALFRLWADMTEGFLDRLGVRPARPDLPGLAFVDLSGFTRLTESRGDATAARLAAELSELAETAARYTGRVVKLLGDGAMLHFAEPLQAVRAALALVDDIKSHDLPPAHAGVHSGQVIRRDGDFFGRTVNLAARIAGQAQPGQVLTSAAVAEQAARDISFEPIGSRQLKGIGRAELYRASWRDS
jgi:adenylate cyclase